MTPLLTPEVMTAPGQVSWSNACQSTDDYRRLVEDRDRRRRVSSELERLSGVAMEILHSAEVYGLTGLVEAWDSIIELGLIPNVRINGRAIAVTSEREALSLAHFCLEAIPQKYRESFQGRQPLNCDFEFHGQPSHEVSQ